LVAELRRGLASRRGWRKAAELDLTRRGGNRVASSPQRWPATGGRTSCSATSTRRRTRAPCIRIWPGRRRRTAGRLAGRGAAVWKPRPSIPHGCERRQ